MTEKINHPSHYNNNSVDLEVIDIISLLTGDRAAFDIGNAIKYICRAPYKKDAPFLEHLEKALWYINDQYNNCSFPGPKKLSAFEQLVLSKYESKLLEGTFEEKICGRVLRKLRYDIVNNYSVRETRDLLEKEILSIKEDSGEHHKRSEQ